MAAEKMRSRVVEIPLTIIGHKPYVKVSVNGSAPLDLILDTGATNSLINLDLMEELGLTCITTVPLGGAGNDEIFGHMIQPAEARIEGLEGFSAPIQVAFPLTEISAFEGSRIDGVLGYEFFSAFAVEIDYAASRLLLYSKDEFEYMGGGMHIPLEIRLNHPHATGMIDAGDGAMIECDIVVDTGAGVSLSLTRSFTEENELLGKIEKKIKAPTGIGVGGITQGYVGRLAKLGFGDVEIKDPIASFMMDENGAFATSDLFEGLIGGEILKDFTVTFDYERNSMYLERRSIARAEYDMSGLFLAREGEVLKIVGMAEDSPAAEAKLRAGDAITQFNATPIAELSLDDLREKLKIEGAIKLRIERENSLLEKRLELRRLI